MNGPLSKGRGKRQSRRMASCGDSIASPVVVSRPRVTRRVRDQSEKRGKQARSAASCTGRGGEREGGLRFFFYWFEGSSGAQDPHESGLGARFHSLIQSPGDNAGVGTTSQLQPATQRAESNVFWPSTASHHNYTPLLSRPEPLFVQYSQLQPTPAQQVPEEEADAPSPIGWTSEPGQDLNAAGIGRQSASPHSTSATTPDNQYLPCTALLLEEPVDQAPQPPASDPQPLLFIPMDLG